MKEIKINLIVNDKTFTGILYDNETVQELITKFPITLNMSELNNNEKYAYLDFTLITNEYRQDEINSSDIKLYGNNCLVIFYDNFKSSYDYTDLGKIDNVDEFINILEDGNVTITFELKN